MNPSSLPSCRFRSGIFLLLFVLLVQPCLARENQRMDDGWSFHLGDAPGAQAPGFDVSDWRSVTLPHDWSIALRIDHAAPAAGHGGFFPGGIGWYRHVISAPESWEGRRVEIVFEGVYMNAEVWINGVELGRHPYGYTPFRFDLTPYLKIGADNVLAVRVDNSAQPNARWYTGSGLYRPVWLRVTNPVHVADDGVFVATSELAGQRAVVDVSATVRNASDAPAAVSVEVAVFDPQGRQVASNTRRCEIAAGGHVALPTSLLVADPQVWTPDTPTLYRAMVTVRSGAKTLDDLGTSFGVRTVSVSAGHGFELNGRPLKLFGGNVHDDTGVLGAAAFDRAEERKVELLKTAGFNAVRTAHNPPSPAFLAACDRLGLLVIDEFCDGWEKPKTPHDYSVWFKKWWKRDVDAWVRRDRNHPSVVMWSTGNEMPERGDASGLRIARSLANRIRTLDATRPLTAGVNGMGKGGRWTRLDPLFATFDVAGYNYELSRYAADHARLPSRVIMATESYQSDAFANWAVMHDHSWVIGDFVWSALDYLGEAGIGRVFPPGEPATKHWEADMYPWHGAYCGDVDLTGWQKPASHYRAIVWNRGEKLYAAVLAPAPGGKPWDLTPWSVPPELPSWTWPGHEGEPLTVEVYSRYDSVRLLLNGQMIGEKPTSRAEEFKAVFPVPYAPGKLEVIGLRKGHEVEGFVLTTAGKPVALRLTADRSKLHADGRDLAYVTVEAVDRHGRWNPCAIPKVSFAVAGPGSLAAAGTGDMTSMESYQGDTHTLFEGRALAVVRSAHSDGRITLTATAPGFPPATLVLQSGSR